jgi:hypothetical protein
MAIGVNYTCYYSQKRKDNCGYINVFFHILLQLPPKFSRRLLRVSNFRRSLSKIFDTQNGHPNINRCCLGQITSVSNILFNKGLNVVDDTLSTMVIDITDKKIGNSAYYQNADADRGNQKGFVLD